MTYATDESIENLKAFVQALSAAIERMSAQAPQLESWVEGITQLDTGAEEALQDTDTTDFLPGVLQGIEDCLGGDEDVQSAITACAEFKTTAAVAASDKLDSMGEDVVEEAGAFETFGDAVADGLRGVQAHLQSARATQSYEAGEVLAAMERLEREAQAAFTAVRKTGEDMVSGLGSDLQRAGVKALTAEQTLSPLPDGVGQAVQAVLTAIEQASPVLAGSHDARREGVEEFYKELENGATATVESLRNALERLVEAHTDVLDACHEALRGDDGVVAAWDASVAGFLAELEAWTTALEPTADATTNLEGLAADLRAAYSITANVVGVINAL